MGAIATWKPGVSRAKSTRRSLVKPVRSESVSADARISVYPIGENHPLVSTFGVFENEPLWDELLRAMNENRQEQRLQELADGFGE